MTPQTRKTLKIFAAISLASGTIVYPRSSSYDARFVNDASSGWRKTLAGWTSRQVTTREVATTLPAIGPYVFLSPGEVAIAPAGALSLRVRKFHARLVAGGHVELMVAPPADVRENAATVRATLSTTQPDASVPVPKEGGVLRLSGAGGIELVTDN